MPEAVVSLTGLARALGVTASAVSNWRKRGTGPNRPPLPEPTWVLYGAPIWTSEQIDAYVVEYRASRVALAERRVSECEEKLANVRERLQQEKMKGLT